MNKAFPGWRFLCDWKGRLILNKPARRGILWVR
nr:MAG TPA: KorB C-terminal beta-barrel domain [Caudoviricetes sp.]DAJ35304.1 MAG TPA: KorB C-terminal beta-barrel domain [Caudoviricetes sp.]